MITRFANPKMEAQIIQDLQEILDTVSWLDSENNYPVAHVGTDFFDKKKVSYPRIYKNDNSVNYQDIRPDKNLKSFSFFEINEPCEFLKDEQEISVNLSLIVWYNLKTLDVTKTYDYSNELRAEIVELLQNNSIDSDIDIEIRPLEIFDKYTGLIENDLKYLGYPYSGFKLTFDANKDFNCLK